MDKHANELLFEFSNEETFSRATLKSFYNARIENLKDSTFNWIVYNLCKDKIIQREGRNIYQLYNSSKTRIPFHPLFSNELSMVDNLIAMKFPMLKFSIWELWMLNEFLNHQLEKNIIISDVEKNFEESVFEGIKHDLEFPILFKPNQKEIDYYSAYVTAAVFPLTQEAPKRKDETQIAPLEKILVDLFANKLFESVISFGEYPNIFEGAFSKYLIDEKAMFRYARRRKKDQDLLAFIKNRTSIRLITEGRINDK